MESLRKFPDTIIIILGILVIFIALTWIVPAGEFDRVSKIIDGHERTLILADSYHEVKQQPQGIKAFFTAPIRGFLRGAQVIAFIFLIGGAFNILTRTNAVDAGLQQIIQFSKKNPNSRSWILPMLIILFSLGGATYGMCEEILVFVLITIPLAIALGYDSIVGLSIGFIGAGAGFAGAFINPFTVGIAQSFAELPPVSGWEYRLFVWGIMTLVAILFIMNYARKVLKDKKISPMYEVDQKRDSSKFGENAIRIELTFARKLCLLLLATTLIGLVIGINVGGWYINEITGLFLAMGIVAAIISGMSADEAIAAFKDGAKDMMTAALVIGLAYSLIVVAEDGKIVDTILARIASAADGLPKVVTGEIMFILQSCLNFFVPSGSGQAALTMPIMTPLSDLLGISRQTAVLAFQFGDGLSNMIIPTSGVTMGVLAVAKVPYNVWFKWFLPLFLIFCALAMLLLIPPLLFFSW